MRSAVPALVLFAPLLLASGSGGVEPGTPPETFLSARFFEVHTDSADESGVIPTHNIVEGAFDWGNDSGWAIQRYPNESVVWRQADGNCFETDGNASSMKIEDRCGLPGMANNPREVLGSMRKRFALKKVGTEEVDGVPTTHYVARRIQRGGGPVQLWADENDVVRRLRFGPKRYPLVIEYTDFGVDADAKWASPKDPPRWTPDQSGEDQ